MTKIDIIQDVYEKLGFSKKDSARIVESVFDIMKDSLTRKRNPGEDEILRPAPRLRSPPERF